MLTYSFLAITLGVALLLVHLLFLLLPEPSQNFLKKIPRSRNWGTLLMLVAVLGALITLITTDLGEFSPVKPLFLLLTVILGFGFWYIVPQFLAVRSWGFCLLLAAHPVLQVACLHEGPYWLLSLLAYGWIIVAFFLIAAPYLFRDVIESISEKKYQPLWKLLSLAGLFYGLLLLGTGVDQLL